ncbi:putative short-subunit dehydrogenase-like oxidoreductase (DUF2520 family) [Dysgonomonas sp. PH5-45]|uniref:Rossmann-like and DUF2520 domain-containing protein n=1 Tax=unclassified Dysgonomonas TaxID=2630389 RepID=UPI00247667E0|nr:MULTISPECIES: DUF2520 domain-containing protein [unclassified Dysgonomonas]MDH6353910.1 putative short-subunit dehydrogenase-like oxidoreductase (DUF2520 family) [Dysgonomonas sp. PH5-45]MDH6386812.1 putative short-subunit dehydrogenase-like oxidoreductase (DUF2520 family) [Dysgonomonas sp. PH5-37]
MKIVLIGAGNLATQLASALTAASHQIVQIYSRTKESAQALAEKTNTSFTTDIKQITSDADIYIFSVTDSVVVNLIEQMPFNNGLWLHTAGSLPMNVFEGYCANFGVIYPFQTFSKKRNVGFRNIPFLTEANNELSMEKINDLLAKVSGSIRPLSSDKRKYMHLTGVFACNFVNHLYHISENILNKEDIPFDIILPLIEETANKVKTLSPQEAQTGPAIRMDRNIIDKHLSLLDDKNHREIYRLLSEDIFKKNKKD